MLIIVKYTEIRSGFRDCGARGKHPDLTRFDVAIPYLAFLLFGREILNYMNHRTVTD